MQKVLELLARPKGQPTRRSATAKAAQSYLSGLSSASREVEEVSLAHVIKKFTEGGGEKKIGISWSDWTPPLSKVNQPGLSKNVRNREAGTDESRFTPVVAPADLPPFEEDMNFEEWLLTAKFNLPLYPRYQRIPPILRALPHDLFVAAVGPSITRDTDVDQCCDTLAQLVTDREEQTLARDFFQRFQKADETDEEYARNLQLLAERAFRGCPRNKIANRKLYEAKTNSLYQLVKLATRKRQELRGPPTFRKPRNWSNAASLYGASPCYTPRPEGTFSTHEATAANTDTPSPKDDSDDICNALFEAAAISMSNLDDLCAQLTHISNYERKKLRQLLLKYANIFSWQEWSKLSLEDEILWYQEDVHCPKRLVAPGSLVQTVLQELHEQLGYVGEKKMLDSSNVRDFCRTCTTCSGFKNPQPTASAPLQPMPTGFPGERRGNRYILVMVDYFTKAAETEPMKSQDAETVASVFFNRWICQHGVPESVHSDQGPNFESRLFIGLCKMCRISKTRTTPAHPQGNGQVERTNRTLIGLLKAFTKDA
ncbi:Transposon Ty3-I Gag-Pol polyprotein [Echinococcus granulosus]|uniref:Transposon Ty3-I Gag-Pol polyprotein n=1 Tax=Echinococcus granulosus TaxID=6210 RepID=W6UKC6_ECHGR|nr:Transposon Ty3-I Gag-Pol polyprotein [Echinococcus granulosus]EUB61626.1 Transposon Ty3-I Gag-Pol polyprotein [Echinococcus granulosus]